MLVDVLVDENAVCSRVWLAPHGTPAVDEVELPARVRRWLNRYHAAEPGLAAVPQDEDLAALGAAIVPPGLAEILTSGAEPPLVVSTGNLLGPIPVAAIRVGSRYLAELARIVVVPAMTLWPSIRGRSPRAGTGVEAYFDPICQAPAAKDRCSWEPFRRPACCHGRTSGPRSPPRPDSRQFS